MKLIGSLNSPYVRKVRIVMAEKKLDYQFVEEDVWGSDAILASNPLGKVPCLVMEGGEAVFDSRVIVDYLDTRSPVNRLIPEPSRELTLAPERLTVADVAEALARAASVGVRIRGEHIKGEPLRADGGDRPRAPDRPRGLVGECRLPPEPGARRCAPGRVRGRRGP